ncbi:hypothetical protein [Microcystis phage LMM01]|uniref:Uncharacterized protein n=1 Tax=Microcystis phage LMM01 TaxID=2856824 RepID=A0A7D7_9CAUD|nr:hypothetical protein MaLMM01_gp023 [Microcystis phage LMM01]BAF36114.1 hypothetical protein [Microcystis phage LMM01]
MTMTIMKLINYLLEKLGKVQFRTLLLTIGLLLAYSLAVIIGRLVYAAGVLGLGDVLCLLGLWHAWQAIADLVPSITQLVSPPTNPSTSNSKTEELQLVRLIDLVRSKPPTNPPTSINLETEGLGKK